MPLTLELSPASEKRVRADALRAGISPEKYAADLIESRLRIEPVAQAPDGKFTEADLEEMIERAKGRSREQKPVQKEFLQFDLEKLALEMEADGEEIAFIHRIRQEIWDENHPPTREHR